MLTNLTNCCENIRLTILNHTMSILKYKILYKVNMLNIEIYVNQQIIQNFYNKK